jgi:hypothetical protein
MSVGRARSVALAAAFLVALAVVSAPVAGAESTCDVANRTVVPHPHYGSLQAAVDAATPGDLLRVTGTCVGHTDVDRDLKIKGHETVAAGTPTLSGGKADTVLHVDEGVTVAVRELTIRDGRGSKGAYPDTWGGGIGNDGTLTLRSVVVRNNRSDDGGGISNRGSLTLAGHTVIKRNHAKNNGGGIDVDATAGPAVLTMNGTSRIRENTAGWGGGVNLYDGSITMNDASEIYNNTASVSGGGISGYCGTMTGVVSGGNVHDNTPSEVSVGC